MKKLIIEIQDDGSFTLKTEGQFDPVPVLARAQHYVINRELPPREEAIQKPNGAQIKKLAGV